MLSTIGIWLIYALIFVWLAHKGKGYDVNTTGAVGFVVQAFAYVATYFSAVALIGFAGLAYMYGMQISLIGIGNAIFGTFFVYMFLAWDTKVWQKKLGARTPAQLLSFGHKSPKLGIFLGLVFAIFLSVYASAVIKGGAVMLANILPVSTGLISWGLAIFVGFLVWWGGLRGVIYTEAMQGFIMLLGIILLIYAVLNAVGGPIDGYVALSKLEASAQANNGFTSFSSGSEGLFVFSLIVVMSISVWAQPQIIQRHFVISTKKHLPKTAIIATLITLVLIVGTYFIAALSRLILPEVENPDRVMAILTDMLLPNMGQQIFIIAIISASLSTTTALYHIAASAFAEDISGKKNKQMWFLGMVLCITVSALSANLDGQIIAFLCTTAWSVIGATALVPYLALVKFNIRHENAAWCSSISGFTTCIAWYILVNPKTSLLTTPLLQGDIANLPPFFAGIIVSLPIFILTYRFAILKKSEVIIEQSK